MKHITILLGLLSLVGSAPLLAADVKRGEALHNANCVSCHARMTGGNGETLYTRSDRRVNSLAGLEAQVRRCESNLELKWFDEDIEDVVTYLNENYYHFE